MGNPEEYKGQLLDLSVGVDYDMRSILRRLVDLQFDRNDIDARPRQVPGPWRHHRDPSVVRGDRCCASRCSATPSIGCTTIDPLTGETLHELRARSLPGNPLRRRRRADAQAVIGIEAELQERLAWFEEEGKLLEAQRLRMRTQYDLEMIQRGRLLQRHRELLDAHRRPRAPASRRSRCSTTSPKTSCSSSTRATGGPQLHGQYEGDRSRKDVLVEHGSGCRRRHDNRRCGSRRCSSESTRCVFLSATAAPLRVAGVRLSMSSKSCARP